MKKFRALFILSLVFLQMNAQKMGPFNNTFNGSLIKSEEYTLTWYMVQDTLKHEMGKVVTEILKGNDLTTFVTNVKLPQATMPWIDSTVVKTKDFAPVYHSSQNQNRDMAINYGDVVTGFYLDKKTNEKIQLHENPVGSFFDSSSYPQLIRWLPLEDGYKETISIFDFNPNAKTGLLTVSVKDVTSETLELMNGARNVWKVYVTDDISNNQVNNYYFIDKASREFIKHEIEVSGRKMVMERSDF